MTAAWVAGSVRARAMTSRRLGAEGARVLAASPTFDDALATLARSPYGHDVRAGQTLGEAQRAVATTAIWNVRVLAGWLPREGAAMLRVLLAAVEVANITDHVRSLTGATVPTPYQLGRLNTAWPRAAATTRVDELRRVLATSTWGDPGGDNVRDIALALQTAWADRVVSAIPSAETWATRWTALLIARELAETGRTLPPVAQRTAARIVGSDAAAARTLAELVAALPARARGSLEGLDTTQGLWRCEALWYREVEREATALTRRATPGADVVLGAVAMLAVDAWRTRAALELAARGGTPMEVFDAVA